MYQVSVNPVERDLLPKMVHPPHWDVDVEVVLLPSSATLAAPPVTAYPSRPLLLLVEVEVEPALLDWRVMSAEPVLLPTGAARAKEERSAVVRGWCAC